MPKNQKFFGKNFFICEKGINFVMSLDDNRQP